MSGVTTTLSIPDDEWGMTAYKAYLEDSGGVSQISGVSLPDWPDQQPSIKRAWIAAAKAVLLRAAEVSTQQ
jgi:hypothetical protein